MPGVRNRASQYLMSVLTDLIGAFREFSLYQKGGCLVKLS
jgi:hypothetical protein